VAAGEHEIGTGSRQGTGEGLSEATARTGHDRDAAREVK
jgi:hypothetical protein